MQCECVMRVKEKIDGMLREQMPEGSQGLEWGFPQIRFGMTNEGIVHLPVFDIKGEFKAPKKAGGFKPVKVDTFLSATFCPFCGVKCKAEEPKSEVA